MTAGIDELATAVTVVTDRVADRLIEAIEHDDAARNGTRTAAVALAGDERRQQLLVGAWISEEVTSLNEERLLRGVRSLSAREEQHVRARAVAELTGAGPLEPYLSDPLVEEIDVNGPGSTWVTYTDGRKIDVGRLWASAAELTALWSCMVTSPENCTVTLRKLQGKCHHVAGDTGQLLPAHHCCPAEAASG